uniref:Uncharacterized protein n=1 Tax=Chromera velia CCMP2878 TaxID=1169474 RepID=A0A0G4GB60_9ALVE|eukprot:Cvel_4441.t1-p1 / transcript=Cvel_4441.t1 / gene=Cvel_4441 / organism=Chromera_velia_CCMP2878 / gene_product=hypothetical protein / transcript_product=hypothetical protein / location=Cvel_scaffold193:93103-95607(+) / protein_length=595 / sequence_SO=supercontig / SO=protein_coding / is_pseudo=false
MQSTGQPMQAEACSTLFKRDDPYMIAQYYLKAHTARASENCNVLQAYYETHASRKHFWSKLLGQETKLDEEDRRESFQTIPEDLKEVVATFEPDGLDALMLSPAFMNKLQQEKPAYFTRLAAAPEILLVSDLAYGTTTSKDSKAGVAIIHMAEAMQALQARERRWTQSVAGVLRFCSEARRGLTAAGTVTSVGSVLPSDALRLRDEKLREGEETLKRFQKADGTFEADRGFEHAHVWFSTQFAKPSFVVDLEGLRGAVEKTMAALGTALDSKSDRLYDELAPVTHEGKVRKKYEGDRGNEGEEKREGALSLFRWMEEKRKGRREKKLLKEALKDIESVHLDIQIQLQYAKSALLQVKTELHEIVYQTLRPLCYDEENGGDPCPETPHRDGSALRGIATAARVLEVTEPRHHVADEWSSFSKDLVPFLQKTEEKVDSFHRLTVETLGLIQQGIEELSAEWDLAVTQGVDLMEALKEWVRAESAGARSVSKLQSVLSGKFDEYISQLVRLHELSVIFSKGNTGSFSEVNTATLWVVALHRFEKSLEAINGFLVDWPNDLAALFPEQDTGMVVSKVAGLAKAVSNIQEDFAAIEKIQS